MWITIYLQAIVINIHQDFVASKHSDFFQGQTSRGLLCRHKHSWETWLSIQEEEEEYLLPYSVLFTNDSIPVVAYTSYHRYHTKVLGHFANLTFLQPTLNCYQ